MAKPTDPMMLLYRSLLLLSLFTAASPWLAGQSGNRALLGAWESSFRDGEGRSAKLSLTISEDHLSMVAYYPGSGEFIGTLGGSWNADWENLSLTYEYDSTDSTLVGVTKVMPYTVTGNLLLFNGDKAWTRVDDGGPGALAGAWEITGRMRDGEMQDLSSRRDGPRKTMKILSGTRFQWIAFDTERAKMIATGGGSYRTTADGLYVESIEFFSRDPSRVGKSLSFDFKLMNDAWVHRGQSSQGKPIHEVWSRR